MTNKQAVKKKEEILKGKKERGAELLCRCSRSSTASGGRISGTSAETIINRDGDITFERGEGM